MKIRNYRPADKKELIELWARCGLINPKNDPGKDIFRKSKVKPGWLLVGVAEGGIVASAMVGYEGHRGWINYLAVSPALRKKGYGREIMAHAEKKLRKLGCPKINLQIRTGNKAVMRFYEKLGFVDDGVISMGKRLIDDSESNPR